LRRIRPIRPIAVLMLAAAAAFVALPAAAQSSGDWSQYQGGAEHIGTAPNGPAPPFRVAWQVAVPPGGPRQQYGLSSPIISGGLAIAVGPTSVVAIDVATGSEAWSLDRRLGPSVPAAVSSDVLLFTEGWGSGPPDATASLPAETGPSPSSSPSAAPAETAGSTLVAVSLPDRSPLWTVDLPGVSRTGVTVSGGLAFVGTNDGTVTAVTIRDGSTAWTADAGGGIDTSLASDGSLVLASVRGNRDSGAQVVAFGIDGTEAWRYSPTQGALYAGSPTVGEVAAYVAFSDNTVRAIQLADGTDLWTGRMNSFVVGPAPALTDTAVVTVDARGQVYRFDRTTGSRVWDFALNQTVFRTSPIVTGGAVVVATADGELTAFDLDAGTLITRLTAADGPLRGLAVGPEGLVAVRGGTEGGMVGVVHDPDSPLTAIESPTVLAVPSLLSAWAIAAVVLTAIVFVAGRNLYPRLGPPILDDAVEDEEDET
jgi:outer membrane protein assembly factor BamB